jgi:hypothetical protein
LHADDADGADEERRKAVSREEDCFLAEQLFGWKWISWHGIPVRGTPRYPTKCRVRQLLSPEKAADPAWRDCLGHRADEKREAVGTEALAYAYGSNTGIAADNVPHYTTTASDDYYVLEQARAIWKASGQWADFVGHLPLIEHYLPGDYSRAAILVIRGINP